jgi:hypothetical protein
MTLPGRIDTVDWYGRGPHENYIDRRTGSAVGRYALPLPEMVFPYERPQETGTRTDTRWVVLSGRESGVALLAVGLPTFEFSAYSYALGDFDGGPKKTQRHTTDLRPRDFVTLNLDKIQMGLGGDTSWGALPHPEYLIRAQPFSHAVALRPFTAAGTDIDRLAGEVRRALIPYHPAPSLDPGHSSRRVLHARVTATPPQTLPWSRSGDAGLMDGITGSVDYRDGEWRMVEAADFEATIDLESPKAIGNVQLAFLLRPASALLAPSRVRVQASADGTRFHEVAAVDVPPRTVDETGVLRIPVRIPLSGEAARFLRIVAQNPGRCPEGQPCAGSPARLAVDEIILR